MKSIIQLALLILLLSLASSGALADNETSTKASGKALFLKKGCFHCHFVEGDGGLIGPPLDGIAKYRSRKSLVNLLTGRGPKRPKRYPGEENPMSHVRVSPEVAGQIADYLLSIPQGRLIVKGHQSPEGLEAKLPKGFKFEPSKPSKSSREGGKIFQESGCFACHMINDRGGRLGPSLNGIGGYRSRAYIESRIATGAIVMHGGKEYRPSSYSMPPSELSSEQITQITDYLMTLPAK